MAPQLNADDLRAALPEYGGTVRLAGLDGPVEVLRDALGVPHARAGSLHDAFFAQGFMHAQDRLWQMDYDRRRAYGRWAEYAGPPGLEQDRLMRRLRLAASARADYAEFDAPTRAMFDAYAAGVNAFIATTPTLPIEYRLVEGAPEPWQPWDSCAVFKVRHVLMGVWGTKLWRARQLRAAGRDVLLALRAGVAVPGPLIVPPGASYDDLPDATGESTAGAEAVAGLWEWGAGSNNWALHGGRTASGKPLLAGDPHRPLDVPNVYYQNHLACPEFDAIGYSFAGVPGFPHFGHNARVAWCITHAGADYQDLYIERFAPADPTHYEYRGEWLEAERHGETIAVRGAAPVAIDVTVTRHGPVVVGDPADGHALALRYTATAAPNAGFGAFLPMLRATSVDELDAAMRPWVDPCNNFLMADVDGNIGYLLRGEVPQRARANAWLPVPGWTGEHEWGEPIPFEELPRSRNPETGFIATANNRIAGPEYPHYISLDYAPPYRAERIVDRLRPLRGATVTDMAAVHADKLSIPSRVFVGMLDRIAPADDRSAEAKSRLLAWDGTMGPDDVAAAIYAVWRDQTIALLLETPKLRPLAQPPAGGNPIPLKMLPVAARLRAPVVALLQADDRSLLPEGEGWPELLAKALARAVAWLEAALGPDMDGWRWGRIHRTVPKHPLSATFPALSALLDPPATEVGGDGDTPQAASYGGLGAAGFTVLGTSVTRYVFDLGDWDRSGWVVPLGASGHPGSPHYADQREVWREQRLYPMLYSWDAIAAEAETRQRLEGVGQ
ncbi:MAG: penicillin acylase family protein [Chloroflexota bacterium]|nr:penicillin acylase family protein [Chloroflexota bacterium]